MKEKEKFFPNFALVASGFFRIGVEGFQKC